jgi:hypothetical protein
MTARPASAPTNRASQADERTALALAVAGVLLVAAAWIVPAGGDVTWSGVAAVTGFGALSCAVTFGWLLPRWSRLEPRPKARRALATSVVATLTIPLLWFLAIPFPLLAASAQLGRAAHLDGERTGTAAAVAAVIGLVCSTLLAVLGIVDALPAWPPRDWHGGGGTT